MQLQPPSDFYSPVNSCIPDSMERNAAGWSSLILSCRNAVLGLVLLGLSLLSFLGMIICSLLIGYLLGMSYVQACAVNHGIRRAELQAVSRKHFLTITVFGVCSFAADIFPLASFILSPGYIIGGCHLFWEKLYPEFENPDYIETK